MAGGIYQNEYGGDDTGDKKSHRHGRQERFDFTPLTVCLPPWKQPFPQPIRHHIKPATASSSAYVFLTSKSGPNQMKPFDWQFR
jgi:hypothetical protein